MASTTASQPRLFGLTADEIAANRFPAPPANHLPFRRLYNTWYKASSVTNVAKKLAELSAGGIIASSPLAFLAHVKSKSGHARLLDYGISILQTNGAQTDLGWISGSFPAFMTIAEVNTPTPTEPEKIGHKLYSSQIKPIIFDFPSEDPVNALVPGKKFYVVAWVHFSYENKELGILRDDIVGQLLADRALAISSTKKPTGGMSMKSLGASVKLAKIGYFFHDKPSEVDYGTIVELNEAGKENLRYLPIHPVLASSSNACIRLPGFTSDLLDREYWGNFFRVWKVDFSKVQNTTKTLSGNEAYNGEWQKESDLVNFVQGSLKMVEQILAAGKTIFPEVMTSPVTNRAASAGEMVKAVRLTGPHFKWDGTSNPYLDHNFVHINL